MGNVVFILQMKELRPNGDMAVINALSSKQLPVSTLPTWFNLLISFHELQQLWKQIERACSGKAKRLACLKVTALKSSANIKSKCYYSSCLGLEERGLETHISKRRKAEGS